MPRIPNATRMGWDSFRHDMFGRVKVSNPRTIWESSHRYALAGQHDPRVANGGSYEYIDHESAVAHRVTTQAGSICHVESFRVMPYSPGKGMQVLQTFRLAPPQTGLRQRIGYFSRENGVFFEQKDDKYFIVLRKIVGEEHTVVETRVEQKDWNVEPFLGMGPTDTVLDFTKSHLMFIELEWLGVGDVRVGFVYNGVFLVAHQFNHTNNLTTTYMQTATLPLRYEIENYGGIATAAEQKVFCSSVILNGDYDKRPPQESAYVSTPKAISTTFVPLTAFRMSAGRTDAVVIPGAENVTPTAAGVYEWQLIKNATITGGTWTPYGRGNVEYNTTMTGYSGGTVVRNGFLNSSNQSGVQANIEGLDRFDLQLGRTNQDIPISDSLLLVVRTLSGNGNVVGGMTWYNVI